MNENDNNLLHIIIDAGAIIKGNTNSFPMNNAKYYSTAETINEIRDMNSRDKLLTLPFEIEIRSPAETSIKISKERYNLNILNYCNFTYISVL